ncbi:hypothetical protein [Porphyromonas phage phage005b_ATCC49417]|uniref:Uncharacterized protein n=1 Tax=Porphyromonas phage phage005a_ATCC49417 TaxID=3154097 RepID=A0AAT9JBX5_9VIRU
MPKGGKQESRRWVSKNNKINNKTEAQCDNRAIT